MTSSTRRRRPRTLAPLHFRIGSVLVGLAASLLSARATASCQAPGTNLLWSYPGNGTVEVPTDADLFFTGDVFGVPSLGGEPLQRLADNAYDLGELEPQTTYEVRWDTAVITFTTGDGPNHAAPGAPQELELTRDPDARYYCPLVEPQGCFDTGPPTVVALEDHTPKFATLVDVLQCDGSVRTVAWPAECGPPMIASYDRIVCVRSRTTLGAGLSEPTDYVCSVPAGNLAAIPRGSECAGAWPPAGVRQIAAAATESPADDTPRETGDRAPATDNDARTVGDASPAEDGPAGCALGTQGRRRDAALSLLAALAIAGVLRRRREKRATSAPST